MEEYASAFPPITLLQVSTSPYILVSTHGEYTEDSKPFRVPPNVYIFETQEIGDYCLTTIDEPLKLLLKHRYTFLGYLMAKLKSYHWTYGNVFKQFIFYEPGDVIYDRKIAIGGGRGARHEYDMDFYRYDFRVKSDKKIMEGLRFYLSDITKRVGIKDVIQTALKTYPDLQNGVVFFFSSCAEPYKINDAQIQSIMEQQQRMKLKFLSYTPIARGGPLDESRNMALVKDENVEENGIKPGNMRNETNRMKKIMMNFEGGRRKTVRRRIRKSKHKRTRRL